MPGKMHFSHSDSAENLHFCTQIVQIMHGLPDIPRKFAQLACKKVDIPLTYLQAVPRNVQKLGIASRRRFNSFRLKTNPLKNSYSGAFLVHPMHWTAWDNMGQNARTRGETVFLHGTAWDSVCPGGILPLIRSQVQILSSRPENAQVRHYIVWPFSLPGAILVHSSAPQASETAARTLSRSSWM